ncbi:MAG: SIMPL domain-containing protein [Deltaproteobacteria bacterium]|nr:SIMPL domain-containing protein [Deltaproteobacteria bacterium]
MSPVPNHNAVGPALISGVCVAIGLIGGGYYIGKGAARFKAESRTVTVKGLVERDVKADQAIWTLDLRRANDDLHEAHDGILADRDAAIAFLKARGFKDDEIARSPTNTNDKLARDYGGSKDDRLRYVVTTSVIVTTGNVDGVRDAVGATEDLLKVGVVLGRSRESETANPRYIVTRFNDLRPQLLAEATRNARAIAKQFAADSANHIGGIHSANQGTIQIFGSDGHDESGTYSPTSTLVKKIRVVSTFEFDLK